MRKSNQQMIQIGQWFISRVGVIYLIVALFCFTCIDFKMLNMRIKTRRLNDNIPNFADVIIFSKHHDLNKPINWWPYQYYLELVLKYVPDEIMAKNVLAYVEFNSGNESKAIEHFMASKEIRQRYMFYPNYNLGVIYYKKGWWKQAAEYAFQAISANQDLTLLLMNQSMIYKQIAGNQFFNYSYHNEINKNCVNAYIVLLNSFQQLHQDEKMIAMANLALNNPQLGRKDVFYYYLGLGYYGQGQLEKAIYFFQQSLGIEKDNPEAYYYLGLIFKLAHQDIQAQKLMQISSALHGKNDPRFPYDAAVTLQFF